jgi:acetyl-CoA carboxylase biotin carboxyl carrier protein
MSSPTFNFQDLLPLLELIKSSAQFSEFKLRAHGIELELKRGTASTLAAPSLPASTAAGAASDIAPAPATPAAPTAANALASAAPRPQVAALGEGIGQAPQHPGEAVTAPMVGTVYLAPEPGAAPFVSLGQRVQADSPVCIVEVMKLMNTVPAGRAGVIKEILVQDAQAVEFGQPLFVIAAD